MVAAAGRANNHGMHAVGWGVVDVERDGGTEFTHPHVARATRAVRRRSKRAPVWSSVRSERVTIASMNQKGNIKEEDTHVCRRDDVVATITSKPLPVGMRGSGSGARTVSVGRVSTVSRRERTAVCNQQLSACTYVNP